MGAITGKAVVRRRAHNHQFASSLLVPGLAWLPVAGGPVKRVSVCTSDGPH